MKSSNKQTLILSLLTIEILLELLTHWNIQI